MAQRRMTSLEVIDTDAFLDMGQGAQLLYFHLNSRADDDGFVSNPKKVLRAIGGNDDDLRLLILKKFLIVFEDGVCVIKHWRVNNFVRKDIYQETNYLDHKNALFIRGNGAYTLTDDGRAIKVPPKHYTLDYVNDSLTERQLRIGKDREGKLGATREYEIVSSPIGDTEKEPKAAPKYPHAREVSAWFPEPEPSWLLNTTELSHMELLHARGETPVRDILVFVGKHRDDEYFPKVNKPSDLERKWNDIQDFADRNGL